MLFFAAKTDTWWYRRSLLLWMTKVENKSSYFLGGVSSVTHVHFQPENTDVRPTGVSKPAVSGPAPPSGARGWNGSTKWTDSPGKRNFVKTVRASVAQELNDGDMNNTIWFGISFRENTTAKKSNLSSRFSNLTFYETMNCWQEV